MPTMPKRAAFLALSLLCCVPLAHAQNKPKTEPNSRFWSRPPIDLVFAIDCSGSMGGVIETAKQKVWDIVNEIGEARPTPRLRIGLLGYGDGNRTWRKFDLSSDLDTVYKNLMTFKDEGWSDEFVGQAVQKSLDEMSWGEPQGSQSSLRVIYVLGNETAAQGEISFKNSAPRALKNDVFVNAIYCGQAGGQDTWQQMAALGGGKYLEIAADGGSVVLPTPYDKPLAQLSAKINRSYLAYGARGSFGAANQAAQDSAALSIAPNSYVGAARAQAKASALYNNSDWDLVDKSREKGFRLEAVPVQELPKEMQKMAPKERQKYLAKKIAEREATQKEIQELARKRSEFLAQENKKSGKANSLDAAILSLVRSQAQARGFRFPEEEKAVKAPAKK